MAFDTRERSNHDGRPILLLDFRRGTAHWRYCTADQDVTFGGDAWTAVALSDSPIVQAGELVQDSFTVTMPKDAAVPQLYRQAPPSQKVHLTVRRHHAGDDEAPVVWIGTVSAVRQVSDVAAEVVCNSLAGTLPRNGLRKAWARGCQNVLYDHECTVDKARFAKSGTISVVSGRAITSSVFAEYPVGRFYGGFIEWAVDGGTERRFIMDHSVADTVTLLGGASGLTAGLAITAYPGCRLTRDDCHGFFGNLVNYGGFAHMPGKSPFSGDPIF